MKRYLSQEELAEKADLSRSTISKLETGMSFPTLVTAAKIANAFGYTFDELFDFRFLNY